MGFRCSDEAERCEAVRPADALLLVMNRLAANLELPALMLAQLVRHHDATVRAMAAMHPRATQASLRQLAADSEWLVRYCVAGNPSARPGLLAGLATDDSPRVRLAAAHHPRLPEAALATLTRDEAAEVQAAARHRTTAIRITWMAHEQSAVSNQQSVPPAT